MKGQHIQYKETPGRYFQRVTGKEVSAQEAGGAFDVVGGTAPSHLLTGGPRPTGSRVVTDTGQPSGQFRLPVGGGAVAGAYQDYLTAQGPTDTRTPEQIRGAYTQQYQSFIDSINLAYSQQISQAQQQGEQRLGITTGAAAAAGRVGSTSFGAQRAGVQAETRGVTQAIEAQRQAAVQNIFTRIDERVEAKLEQQKKSAITKAETRIKMLEAQVDETIDDIRGLAQQGVSIEQLNPQDKQDIMDLLGKSEFELEMLWNEYSPQAAKYEWGWRGDSMVGIKYDPVTNEIIDTKTYSAEEMGIPVEKKGAELNFKTIAGQTYWYDENDPINPDGTPKMFPIGEKAPGRAPTAYESKKADLNRQLEAGTITQDQYNEALLGVEAESITEFTEIEKRKLEQEFGSEWTTTTSRQDQLDFLYKKEGSEIEDWLFPEGSGAIPQAEDSKGLWDKWTDWLSTKF